MLRRLVVWCGLLGLLLLIAGMILYTVNPESGKTYTIPAIVGLVLVLIFTIVRSDIIERFIKSRSTKYGSGALVYIILVLGILVMINFLSVRHHKRFDLTKSKLHSLSDQTRKALKDLKKEVKITAFFKEGTGDDLKDLLQEYEYNSRKFSYEFIDPDKNPGVTKRYKVESYGIIVVESGKKEERITETTERDLTNAILKVVRKGSKVIYFTEGHGETSTESTERTGNSVARDKLKEGNYEVKTVVLASEGKVPPDCAVLVVVSPRVTFFPPEVDAVRSYLEDGGKTMFLFDPGQSAGLDSLLGRWGVVVGNNFVIDLNPLNQFFGVDYSMPIASQYGVHQITERHRGPRVIMTFYPLARSVHLKARMPSGIEGAELVKTSNKSWTETDLSPLTKGGAKVSFDEKKDKPGPISLAVAVNRQNNPSDTSKNRKSTRIVAFGDSDFANNQFFLQPGPQGGNGDLFLNSINWLAQDEELISIRPKEAGYTPINLNRSQARTIFWFSVVLLPVAVLITGLTVWWKRH